MLQINNVIKCYDGNKVLDVSDIKITPGESVGLIGNNGTGKTTLLKSIVDLIQIDKGNIFYKKEDITKTEDWKDTVSIFLDSNLLIPYLTPKEYLLFVGKVKNVPANQVQKFILNNKDFYKDELFDKSKKLIRDLSKGNKQKVGIMSALLGKKDLILMDEPFSGLDVSSKKQLVTMLKDINKKSGSTMVISSHNLRDVLEVTSRIIIMKKGKICVDVSSKSINENDIARILEE